MGTHGKGRSPEERLFLSKGVCGERLKIVEIAPLTAKTPMSLP